jgi:hypothetical protein
MPGIHRMINCPECGIKTRSDNLVRHINRFHKAPEPVPQEPVPQEPVPQEPKNSNDWSHDIARDRKILHSIIVKYGKKHKPDHLLSAPWESLDDSAKLTWLYIHVVGIAKTPWTKCDITWATQYAEIDPKKIDDLKKLWPEWEKPTPELSELNVWWGRIY